MLVAKFGGTSVGNVRRIKYSARIIQKLLNQDKSIIIVVSAMAGVTNQLCSELSHFNSKGYTQTHDFVVSAGEQITTGLFSLALEEFGIQSKPLLAWQIPIVTDDNFGKARIQDIDVDFLKRLLAKGVIPVIAGFQGITANREITTLGRGGSDTTAVEVAVATNSDHCYIFTDVEGIYSADPMIVPSAQKINNLTYNEVVEMAESGAKVLEAYSARVARENKTNVSVLSSFIEGEGTQIVGDISVPQRLIAICHKTEEEWIKISLIGKNIIKIINQYHGIMQSCLSDLGEVQKTTDRVSYYVPSGLINPDKIREIHYKLGLDERQKSWVKNL